MERDVQVREVGPRDGLQLVKTFMPTETKIKWIKAEAAAGVIDFEVTSFVPPSVIPQFADAREVAIVSEEYGPHLPAREVGARVYVLRKLSVS